MDLFWGGIVGLVALTGGQSLGKSPISKLGRVGYGFCIIQIVIAMPIASIWPRIAGRYLNLDIQDTYTYCFPFVLIVSLLSSSIAAVALYHLWQVPWTKWAGDGESASFDRSLLHTPPATLRARRQIHLQNLFESY